MSVVATLSKGYDLDYIRKQVDRGPAKDAASYYVQASESGGEPPGRWWGLGAAALGLEPGQVVERELYDLLFGERRAPDGSQLGKPPGSGRKAADIYARLLAAVALSRGTEINMAYVFTASPKLADLMPGPRPAPELARYDRITAERTVQPAAAAAETRIASGEITSRLPGERALQQEFGLAPVTIRKAVRQLRDEGLVRTTPGWGTYVMKKNDDANP
jgi:hypothetical protein